MSLTRDEWLKMWEAVKTIESATFGNNNARMSWNNWKLLEDKIQEIKQSIQKVVGQME